tara:strand:- start:9747 stop:10400 length:654 start_codon:yes stop_codon:yes gene_type:complete
LRNGIFISLEGIDGSGKTTQLERLRLNLVKSGHSVVVAQEPGGTRLGRRIREILLDAANQDLRPISELLLYFASRSQNIDEVIIPALETCKVVISDRFTDATLAYQGHGRNLGIETVRTIERIACRGIQPDLTLLLDIDPKIGVQRALARNETATQDESRMEREDHEFFCRVRDGYLELAAQEPNRIKIVDARKPVDELETEIFATVEALFSTFDAE